MNSSISTSCLQVEAIVESPLNDLFPDFPAASKSIDFAASRGGLKLRGRAVHVFSEAARVLRFRNMAISDDHSEVRVRSCAGVAKQCCQLPQTSAACALLQGATHAMSTRLLGCAAAQCMFLVVLVFLLLL